MTDLELVSAATILLEAIKKLQFQEIGGEPHAIISPLDLAEIAQAAKELNKITKKRLWQIQ